MAGGGPLFQSERLAGGWGLVGIPTESPPLAAVLHLAVDGSLALHGVAVREARAARRPRGQRHCAVVRAGPTPPWGGGLVQSHNPKPAPPRLSMCPFVKDVI